MPEIVPSNYAKALFVAQVKVVLPVPQFRWSQHFYLSLRQWVLGFHPLRENYYHVVPRERLKFVNKHCSRLPTFSILIRQAYQSEKCRMWCPPVASHGLSVFKNTEILLTPRVAGHDDTKCVMSQNIFKHTAVSGESIRNILWWALVSRAFTQQLPQYFWIMIITVYMILNTNMRVAIKIRNDNE